MSGRKGEAKAIIRACNKCVEFYEEKPGYVSAATIIDLYRAIARLAKVVEWQRNEIERLESGAP